MKKIFYFVLLIAELFVDSMLMLSLWNSSMYIPPAVSVAAVVGLLIWQLVWFFKTNNPAKKRTVLRNLPLIMLIPMAVFVVTYIVVAIAFIIAFS